MDFELFTLSNGIKVAHRRIDSPVAYCCLMVNAGTRDESEQEHGLAHFIEHMMFKGTAKRRAHHILRRLDNVGGELNAYTTKEETVVHSTCLREDYARAVELIADIVFCSAFPEREIRKEQDVVVDEINSYRDSPSELIYDDFETMVYAGHPLAHNILGVEESVRSFGREHLRRFVAAHYCTDQMVWCSVADVPTWRVRRLMEQHLEPIPANRCKSKRPPVGIYTPSHRLRDMATHQAHCLMGAPAYNLHSDRRHALFLLSNILGGPGMNSRLNIALRERHGFAYSVESAYQPYSDTGLFTISFGTDPKLYQRAYGVVHTEIDKLQQHPLTAVQLSRAKRQLVGQLAIASESNEALMLSAAKGFLVYDEPEDAKLINERIEAITANDLLAVAQEVLNRDSLSYITYVTDNAR